MFLYSHAIRVLTNHAAKQTHFEMQLIFVLQQTLECPIIV